MTRRTPPAALLLTGGASRRMGFDKAGMLIDGEICAQRMARLLREVATPVIEVGPGWTGLPCAREDPIGDGPLAAVAAGAAKLDSLGHIGPVLVLACDLPEMNAAMLELLAEWPGDGSVVPVADGRRQPLCARWSIDDLAAAVAFFAAGERSLRSLPRPATSEFLSSSIWSAAAGDSALRDADRPEDLDRLGVPWRRAVELPGHLAPKLGPPAALEGYDH